MKKNILVFSIICLAIACKAQTIPRYVIASSGGSAPSGSINSTVGEPIVGTVISGSNLLSQGFQKTDYVPIGTTTSIAYNSNELEINAYPNPTTDILNIYISSQFSQKGNILIFDIVGKKMYSASININGGLAATIDVSTFPAGTYILQIITNQSSKNIKFQKI